MRATRHFARSLLLPSLTAAVATMLLLSQPSAPPLTGEVLRETGTGDGGMAMAAVLPATSRLPAEAVAATAPAPVAPGDVDTLMDSVLAAPDGTAATTVLRRFAARRDLPVPGLLVAVLREPRCRAGDAGHDSPAEFALQELLRASRSSATARAGLITVAFDAVHVPALHRERAARAYVAGATHQEATWFRDQVERAGDALLRTALQAVPGDDAAH